MGSVVEKITDKAEQAAVAAAIEAAFRQVNRDREGSFVKVVDLAQKFIGDKFEAEQFDEAREVVRNQDNRWIRYINKILDETDPVVAKKTLVNLGYNAFLKGTKMINKNRVKYGCNIPWLILFDPTTACNMHCAGCWSGTYGHKHNMSFEDMDKIVTQGKELGVYLYMMTGGEPMVRKKDVFALARKHNDVQFAIYTNSTLIDEDVCKECVELGNIIFMLSIEGTPETNDARRGDGHYSAVMNAMDLLKKHGLIFGTSICYTRQNIEAVTSDEFFHLISDKGARFGFYFHYMPVGNNAVVDLMPTIEQRKYMIDRIRQVRGPESDIEFYPMDFQNDGEYVGGCIAGGRNYFHINSAGDAEPCVFIHYSDTNIHDNSILEMLQAPLFMAYHDGQPFNKNHLRPCPMLENPQKIRDIVHATGAHQTNLESPESVEHLTEKTEAYAAEWAPAADEIEAEKQKEREERKARKAEQREAKERKAKAV